MKLTDIQPATLSNERLNGAQGCAVRPIVQADARGLQFSLGRTADERLRELMFLRIEDGVLFFCLLPDEVVRARWRQSADIVKFGFTTSERGGFSELELGQRSEPALSLVEG